MKLSKRQLEAAGYIFERDRGIVLSDHELNIISTCGVHDLDPAALEKTIAEGLSKSLYEKSSDRCLVYWALGKRFNRALIPTFRKSLENELAAQEPHAVYQLLIALDNLGEPVFDPDRDGSVASHETQLNLRDAGMYLKNYE